MKIYIIIENEIIRCATASKQIANKICESFKHLGLRIEEYETISDDL